MEITMNKIREMVEVSNTIVGSLLLLRRTGITLIPIFKRVSFGLCFGRLRTSRTKNHQPGSNNALREQRSRRLR